MFSVDRKDVVRSRWVRAFSIAVLCAGIGTPAAAAAATLVRPTAASAASQADSSDWLGEVNRYRSAAGLGPVSSNSGWVAGLQAHLGYLVNTPASYMTGQYASAHTENPTSPYYTEAGDTEARSSDLALGGQTTPVGAIDNWLTAPFHAIGILRPQLTQVGFALDTSTGYAGLDIIQGIDYRLPKATAPVLFPGRGMTTDLSTYNGGELPSPLETCGLSAPAGLPLIALLPAAPSASLQASVRSSAGATLSSTSGDLCVVDEHTFRTSDGVYGPTGRDILAGDHAVLLVPRAPLRNAEYTASITQPGVAPVTWNFSVQAPTPVNVAPPTIYGSTEVGDMLSASDGDWSNSPTGFSRTWRRCAADGGSCTDVAGATGTTYALTQADVGRRIGLSVAATNTAGDGTPADAAPSAVVTAPSSQPPGNPDPAGSGPGGTSTTITSTTGAPGVTTVTSTGTMTVVAGGSSTTTIAPGGTGTGSHHSSVGGTAPGQAPVGDGSPGTSDDSSGSKPGAADRPGHVRGARHGNHVIIRWNQVKGAVRYRVTVRSGGRTRSATATATHLSIALRRGRRARVSVRARLASGGLSPASHVVSVG